MREAAGSGLKLIEREGALEFPVIVSAGSQRPGPRGLLGDALKFAVRAAPEAGRANAELAGMIAGLLNLSPAQVRVTAGFTSRRKKVCVRGAGSKAIRELVRRDQSAQVKR